MLRNFDLDLDMSKIGKDLKVQLALPNKKIIKNIKNITNASIDEVELNGLPIFTFEIPHKVEIVDFDTDNIEIVDNDDINNIKEEMLIKVTWYNGTKVNWFRVSDITKEENEENTFMVVESKSLPSELRATNVSINKESIDIIEYFETVLYQSPWKLGTVSDKLKNTYRSFDDDKKTRYEAVMSGIETFGAILDWDEENRILNLKSIDDIREFRGVVLKRENYASSVSVQSSSEEIVTRLYSYGNEGLGIENSNPSGMPYIEDFSYFMSPFKRDGAKNVLSSSSYMSDELCHALLDLEDLKAEYNPKIQNLQNMINSAYTDLSRDMLALQEKQGQLITLQALLDTAKSTNDKDLIYQREMEIRDKELEISTLEENIENIEISIEEWDRQIFNFQQLISTSSFTTELIDELSLFVYEKEFNDDRYIDSQELYEASLEQMEKYQSPVKSFSIDLDSFINSLESQVFNGRLQIGEEVIIKSNKLNMEYRSIILGYNVDFESGHFELNISDNLDDISALDKLASIIYKAESNSTILNNNKYKWDGITSVVDEVSQWRDKEISTVENRITAGANESIVIDNRGIQAHNPDFPDERLIMQSGVIALSKDGGKTWNTSITPDGVIAETIIGKLFAGNNLIITNESGSFVIDSTGLNVNMDSIKIMSGSESNPKDMIDLWNNLLLTYEEILDDGLITQHEKNQLQKQWNTIIDINSSMLEVFEKAWKDLEDSEPADSPKPKPKPKEYNDYILAYSELDKYLNVTIQSDGYAILDKDNREETTQVDSIVFAQKFKNYNEKKTIFESIIPLEFSNGKIEVLENGISLTYTKNSEIVTMLNLSEEGVRIDGKLLEINSRTEFNADLVMNAGVIKGADNGIIIDLNEGTIELNKPIKIGLGSNLVTKDDLEVLELEAYTVVLSNDNSFITTDKDGNNGDFSHAVSTVTVYKGATDDTSNWNITAVKSNGVVGALSGRTYTVTNMVGDSGKVIFTATHKSNSELSISKDFNIIKTKAGLDGEDGKIKNINLVSDGYVISYKGEQPLPAKQTIKMQAFTDGLEGIAVWEIVPYKNNIAQSPITKSVVNNTIEINELDFANSVDMIKVKITCDGLIDTATIVKIRNGLDGNSGKDGIAGKDGVGVKSTAITYSQSTSGTTAPTSDWSTSVPTPLVKGQYLWTRTTWTYTDNSTEVGYTVSYNAKDGNTGKDGIAGKDGVGISGTKVEYVGSTSGTTKPASGWSTTIPTVAEGNYLWTKTTWTYTDGTTETGYSVAKMGAKGDKGDTGATGAQGPRGLQGAQGPQGNQGIQGPKGLDGKPSYTHIAYADTITGSGFSHNDATKPFIGIYADSNPTSSETASKYTWSKWHGEDGSDGVQGPKGDNGQPSYTHFAYANNATGTSGFSTTDSLNKSYLGIYTDNIKADSSDPSKYTWTLIKGATGAQGPQGVQGLQGPQGNQGIKGDIGATGKSSYTHIAYATGDQGQSFNHSTFEQATHVGMYVSDNQNSSGNWRDYQWTLIRGRDGSQGIQGIKGADGKTPYFHIAYANNSTGTSGFSINDSTNKLYIGTYTDFTEADSTDPSKYAWTLIKGDKGDTGATGKDGIAGKDGKGISSTTITYGLSTTDTVEPTKYNSSVPTLVKGQYLWTKTVWKYTDDTTETGYTKTYIAKDGNTGKDGIAGKDGVGISKTTITYAGSTSGTVTPTSEWTTAVPTVAEGNFLWTKTTWTYTDNSTEVGYSVAKMGSNGATGATGAQGASATSYWITASNNIIAKSQTGVINPTTITFKGFSKTGTANSALYAGRFIIQTSTNGTTYATKYTSSANQNAYTYTIPADTKFIKALFYQAGGTSVLLDEQTVPVVESAEGIQVGGENILQNSTFQEGLEHWSVDSQHITTVVDGVITLKNQSGQRWPRFYSISPRLSEIKKGDIYTLSFEAKGDTRLGDGVAICKGDASNTIFRKSVDYSPEWKRYTLTFTASLDWVEGVRLEVWTNKDASTSELTTSYRNFKLEKGTVATDWTPAPEDARTYKAWANSADGREDFTKVYPNENLWIDSLSESGYVVSNGDNIGDVISGTDVHRVMTELVPVEGTEIVYQFWNPNKVVNSSNSNRIAFFKEDKTFISYITNRLNGEAYKSESISLPSGTKYLRIGFIQGTPTDRDMDIKFKVEEGSEPTIYTTNPQDSLSGSIPKYVGFSPLDSENPTEFEWIVNPEYAQALADEELENKADKGVVNELQTVLDLFLESYEGFVEDGGQHEQDLLNLEQRITQILVALEDKVFELDFLKTYMKFGEEGFMIGKDDSQIKMLLKNDRLSFIDAGQEVAFFSGQSFHINRGAIVQSLQVGQHKLTNLSNGHTIFQYVG